MDIATLGIKVESDGVTKASDRLEDLAMKAAQAAAAILSIGAAADAWVKFDSATRAAANLTGAALEDVKRMANDVGAAMGKFSGDVATAAGQVGSFAPALLSNLPALQSVTEASLTLAEAAKATGDAMTDTQGAQAITAALNQWGVSADDAIVKSREFANVLAAGAKEGSASVTNIVAAMANAGTTAASAKIKFEEFTGAIETMAEKQLLGAEAGTALRNMIAKLSTSDAVFKEMGISGVSATLATEGLQAALQKLAPISQNNTLLVKAFGQENLNASQILIQNAGRIGEFTAKITGTSTAYEQAQAGLATFSRQVEIFSAMLQNIGALAIDSIISPVAAPALQQVNEILKEVFGELQAFNDSDMPAAIRYEFELWGDNLSNLIPLIDAITSGWIMAYDAVNQIPLALDLIDGQIDSVSSKTTLADIFIYAYEQVMNLPSAITVFGAMAAAEFEAVKQSLIAVWLDGKSFAAEMFRSIGNWINVTAESIANMQKGFATAIRDFADGAAQLAVSADAVAGTNLSGKVMAARDAAAAWAIETIQGSKAAKAATIEYNNVVDQQISGYQAQKEGGQIAVQNARAAAELAIKQNDAAISADRLSRENAKNERETSKAFAAIEKENAALMGVKEKTDKASAGMATLADKSNKAAGEISLTADEIVAASESLIDFEKVAQAGIDAVEELRDAQKGKLFDLEQEIQYLSIADEKERERLKYLDQFSGEYRDQAAALYDQKQAVLEQNSAWESVKSAATSFFEDVLRTGDFSFKKLWGSFKKFAFDAFMSSMSGGKGIMATLSSFIPGIASAGGGKAAAAAGSSGGGGLLGGLGSIANLGSSIASASGLSGLVSGVGSMLGSSTISAFGAGMGMTSGAASAAAGAYGAAGMGGVGSAITAGSMASMALPAIGLIAALPQIKTLLTGNWGTKGLFASGDIMGGDFSIGRTREKKGLLGKKSKRETFDPTQGGFEDVRDALEGTWSTLDSFKGEMLKLAGGIGQAFGKDITGEFQNQFKATLNIDASGEEFSKQLNKWLSDTTGQALKTALDLALAGDASQFAATIRELTGAAGEDVNQVTALVNGLFSLKAQMSVLTMDTELLTPALISASGGIEQLQGSLNFFYEQFYTDTERAAAQLESANTALASGFAELGLAVPETRAEFRALVESLRATTGGADETLAGLLKLAGSADAVYDAAEGITDAITSMFNIDVANLGQQMTNAIFNASSAEDAGNQLANQFTNTFYQGMIGSVMNTIAQSIMGAVVQPFLTSASTAAMNLQSGGIAAGTAMSTGGSMAAGAMAGVIAEARTQIDAMKQILSDPEIQAGLQEIQGLFQDVGSYAYTAFQPVMQSMPAIITQTETVAESFKDGGEQAKDYSDLILKLQRERELQGLDGLERELAALRHGYEDRKKEAKDNAQALLLVDQIYFKQREDLLYAAANKFYDWQSTFGRSTALQDAQKAVENLGISSGQFAEMVYSVDFESVQGIAKSLGVSVDELMQGAEQTLQRLREIEKARGDLNKDIQGQISRITAESGGMDMGLYELRQWFEETSQKARETGADLVAIERLYGMKRAEYLQGALESALKANADSAITALQASVNAEKERLTDNLEAQKSTLDKQLENELDSLSAAHDWRMKALEAEKEAAQDNAQKFRAIADSLRNAVEGLGVQSEAAAKATRQNAQNQLRAWAAAGVLPSQGELDKALGGLGGDSQRFFGSFQDYVRDTVRTAADVGSLAANAEKQASDAERLLASFDSMAEADNTHFEADQAAAKARHDEALALAQAQYDEQVAGLEQTLTDAENQLAALLGIDTSILSVAEAVNGVQAALGLYAEAVQAGMTAAVNQNQAMQEQVAGLISQRAALTAETQPQTEILPGIMTTAAAAVEDIAVAAEEITRLSNWSPEPDITRLSNWTPGEEITRLSNWSPDITRLSNWTGVPAFADGGNHTGGLAVVGEEGAELVDLPPARIHSNKASGLAFDELIAELRQLREDLNAAQYQIAKNTGKSVKMLELWNGDGLPETRTI